MPPQLIQLRQLAFQRFVVERRVDLLMTRLAQRHALLCRAATRLGRKVMQRDQPPRDVTFAQGTPVVWSVRTVVNHLYSVGPPS